MRMMEPWKLFEDLETENVRKTTTQSEEEHGQQLRTN